MSPPAGTLQATTPSSSTLALPRTPPSFDTASGRHGTSDPNAPPAHDASLRPPRIVAHPQIAYEPASKPAFQKVSILVEIDSVERFNIEIVRKDGILTVEDILTWAQKVLRERLEPRVMGGCYKEKCSLRWSKCEGRRRGTQQVEDALEEGEVQSIVAEFEKKQIEDVVHMSIETPIAWAMDRSKDSCCESDGKSQEPASDLERVGQVDPVGRSKSKTSIRYHNGWRVSELLRA
ncbi:hypothetical protein EV421DRAFT_1740315 [Armillaria borealis]|uniref:Uncharacterized protein n=1 Tax=Armillaria borealis TaxID=47425 RepID=A0AA39MJ22_9AGAR|nr:hypothetical protein EV421DRAFT_1740315 [Armillaria borealis]